MYISYTCLCALAIVCCSHIVLVSSSRFGYCIGEKKENLFVTRVLVIIIAACKFKSVVVCGFLASSFSLLRFLALSLFTLGAPRLSLFTLVPVRQLVWALVLSLSPLTARARHCSYFWPWCLITGLCSSLLLSCRFLLLPSPPYVWIVAAIF